MQAHKLIQSRAGARVDPYFSKDTQVAHGRTRVAQIGGLGQDLSGLFMSHVKVNYDFTHWRNDAGVRARVACICDMNKTTIT